MEALAKDLDHSPLKDELLASLTASPKFINPKFFYDEQGSQLFDQITSQPEYYPTRTEVSILQQQANAIAGRVGPQRVLIEPGAGSCEKIRHLLPALQPAAYVPLDISGDFLHKTAAELRDDFPWLDVAPVAADFCEDFELPETLPAQPKVVFYPGSTLGNFEPEAAGDFLARMARLADADGGVLLGADLPKDPAVLNAAYNDRAGVTAAFNRNVINHLNHLLGCDLDPTDFHHKAFFNETRSRIEMHLVAKCDQQVNCDNQVIEIARGESIHTENSYKYSLAQLQQLAEEAGLSVVESWFDDNQWFGVHYLQRA